MEMVILGWSNNIQSKFYSPKAYFSYNRRIVKIRDFVLVPNSYGTYGLLMDQLLILTMELGSSGTDWDASGSDCL